MSETTAVLSTKQMKLSSFVNFYNKKLIEAGPDGTKEMVESISHLFGPVSDQISFLNQYLDYETSLTLEYKDSCKQLIKSQKLVKKNNDAYQKSLLKYQAQYHKLFLKTLKNNNAFADLILLHLTDQLLPLLPPNQTNPKHALINLQPNIIRTLSNHALQLNHLHPINILLNIKPTPQPPNNYNQTNPNPHPHPHPHPNPNPNPNQTKPTYYVSLSSKPHMTETITQKEEEEMSPWFIIPSNQTKDKPLNVEEATTQTEETSTIKIPDNSSELNDVVILEINDKKYLSNIFNNDIYDINSQKKIGRLECDATGDFIVPPAIIFN
jgi:hypothetical protein